MTAVLVALSLAASPELPPVVEVVGGNIETRTGRQAVDGGCYLPASTCVAKADELRRLRAETQGQAQELAALKAAQVSPVGWVVSAFIIGAAAGASAVFVLRR